MIPRLPALFERNSALRASTLLGAAACLLMLSPLSAAAAPTQEVIGTQVQLTHPDGRPLEGTVNITASLWDSATGGNRVYGPEQHNNIAVTTSGVARFELGSVLELSSELMQNNPDLWMQVSVGSEVLAERVHLTGSVATFYASFAAKAGDAERLGGLAPSAYAPAGHNHVASDVTDFDSAAVAAVQAGGVPWGSVGNVPPGFADGVDNEGITAETDPQVGTLTNGRFCRANGGAVQCDQTLPGETDPQVGALTNGRWCRASGGTVVCDQSPPAGGGTATLTSCGWTGWGAQANAGPETGCNHAIGAWTHCHGQTLHCPSGKVANGIQNRIYTNDHWTKRIETRLYCCNISVQ